MKLKVIRTRDVNNNPHFKLIGEMTVYSVSKLKNLLYNELKKCSGLTLDLTEIDGADTSGFQLLLFLKREAGMLDKGFGITGMSARLKSIFSLYRETT